MHTVRRSLRGSRLHRAPHAVDNCPMRHVRAVARASAAVLFAAVGGAQALPQGGVISAGGGSISQPGTNSMTITQTTQKLSLNWQSFDIGAGQSVVFNQPGASSIVLNRVLDQNPTSIVGNLTANGQVFVVNPSGIVFGSGASVNVGGLVASSHPVLDSDFLKEKFIFSGADSNGDVTAAAGSALNAKKGGYIALVGPKVRNAGTINGANGDPDTGKLGTVLLAGGRKVTLTLSGNSLLGYSVDEAALASAVNSGRISAPGGRVFLTTDAVNGLASSVVNNTGIIEAQTIDVGGKAVAGSIQLLAGNGKATVGNGAVLDVSAPLASGGNGGRIDTVGRTVSVESGVTIFGAAATSGRANGTWRIAQTASGAALNIAGTSPDVSAGTVANALASTEVTVESAGELGINGAVSWSAPTTLTLKAASNVNLDGNITNSGSGNVVLRADSAGTGTGTIKGASGPNPAGHITVTGGHADLYFNPSTYSSAEAGKYGAYVTGDYTAWMLVNDLLHLGNVRNYLAGNYALGRDIDASASASAAFAPIGNASTPFTGTFDGLGKEISGLNISAGLQSEAGLFGVLDGTVKNLGVVNSSVSGGNASGLIAGINNGEILNSYTTGQVSADSSQPYNIAGGIAGYNYGLISGSWSSASVSAREPDPAASNIGWAGGLVGDNYGTIEKSFATGSVEGSFIAGGLVGVNESQANITDAYSTGTVRATKSGGFAGGFVGENDGTISRAYTTSEVLRRSSDPSDPLYTNTNGLGGFAGAAFGDFFNTYYLDRGRPAYAETGAVRSYDTHVIANLYDPASFAGFDFSTVWKQYNGATAPLLRTFLKPLTVLLPGQNKVYEGQAGLSNIAAIYSEPAAAAPGSAAHVSVTTDLSAAKDVKSGGYGITYGAWSDQRNGWDITLVELGPESRTFNINQKGVTSDVTAQDRAYNGGVQANVQVTNLGGGGAVVVDGANVSGRFLDKNVSGNEAAKQVIVQAVLLDGTDKASNFMYYSPDVQAKILRKAVNVNATSATKTYDGSSEAAGTPTAVLVTGDSLVQSSQSFESKNAGARKVNALVTRINDAGGNDMTGNYLFNYTTADGTIEKAPLTITAQVDSKPFDGTASSSKAPSVTGLIAGDRITASQTFDASTVGDRTLAAQYTIDDGNGGGNYQVAASTAKGSIYFTASDVVKVDDAIKNPGSVGGGNGGGGGPGGNGGNGNSGDFRLPAAILNGVGDAYGTAVHLGSYPGSDAGSDERVALFGAEEDDEASSKRRKKAAELDGRAANFRFDVDGAGIRLPEGIE